MGKTIRLYFAKSNFVRGDFLKKRLEEGGFEVVLISCLSAEAADHPLPYIEIDEKVIQGMAAICGYAHKEYLDQLEKKHDS
ncbi:MAG: hypothetical protein AAB796_01915 [Patescibacteria group bacterium]